MACYYYHQNCGLCHQTCGTSRNQWFVLSRNQWFVLSQNQWFIVKPVVTYCLKNCVLIIRPVFCHMASVDCYETQGLPPYMWFVVKAMVGRRVSLVYVSFTNSGTQQWWEGGAGCSYTRGRCMMFIHTRGVHDVHTYEGGEGCSYTRGGCRMFIHTRGVHDVHIHEGGAGCSYT